MTSSTVDVVYVTGQLSITVSLCLQTETAHDCTLFQEGQQLRVKEMLV